MNRREILGLLPVVFLPSCAGPAPPVQPAPAPPRRTKTAPDHGFTAVHLDAAVKLQAESRSECIRKLRAMARAYDQNFHLVSDKPSGGAAIIALCRMLFVRRRGGAAFRAPMLGAPSYPGDTVFEDWPLTPITIVDGAPFEVVTGYLLAGQAEPAAAYLEFVLSNCDWTSFQYRRLSRAARMAACQSLFHLPVWREPLDEYEQVRFLEQAA